MQAEDRLIHVSTELLHPPAPKNPAALRKLYYELSETRAAYDSTDFSAPGQVRFHSRRGKQTQSIALFMPDRIVLIEEWADIALIDFLEKVRIIGLQAMAACGIEFFAAQTATLRSTFALTHFDDARVFILDHMCRQTDRIGPYFGRPIGVGGLRFMLPETPDHPGVFHVTIESFRHSVREVFVEVRGIFGQLHINPAELEMANQNIQSVRRFITSHVFPYLNQYDVVGENAQ